MADIRPKIARTGQADLGVHVGAIHVDLTAVGMNDAANFGNLLFKDAVGGGVSDHERGQVGAVLFGLGAQIGQVHIAILITLGDHHIHARHDRAGGVGAMRRRGNETDGAMALPLRLVIGTNHQQSGIFALGTGVGLQRGGGKAGDLGQPTFQAAEHLLVAGGL